MPFAMRSPKHQGAEPVRPKSAFKGADAEDATKMLQLIEAAEYVFCAKGYHSATMNDVAKAAGMSKKTIYQLIESKAGLFAAMLDHHREKLVIPEIREGWSIQENLEHNLLCLAEFVLSPQQISTTRLIMAEYTHSRDFGRVLHQKMVMKGKLQLENCLLRIGPPLYGKLEDVRQMSAMLFGMALGEFHFGVLIGFRAVPNKAVLTRRIRMAVELFLSGCEK